MNKKILLIEDNDNFRRMVKSYLEKQLSNIDVYEASNGELGIEMAVQEKPEIVITDLRLENIHGIEAANEIKKSLPDCKIIVLTMFEAESFREIFKSNHINGYIGKSELYDKLVPALKKILVNN